MHTITLSKIEHRGQARLALDFAFNHALIDTARQIKDYRYSKTLKKWHYPYSIKNIDLVKQAFMPVANLTFNFSPEEINNQQADVAVAAHIQTFKNWLQSKRYSASTIKTYSEAAKTFLDFYKNKLLADITNDDLIRFNVEYIIAKKLSAAFQNQVVNAIKLFFITVTNRKIEIENIHRPKREKLLPNVLSKEEVKLILNAHNNLKHKAMLSLIYSCGLRRGELLKMKITDIDAARKLIMVRQAKGKKDRIVPLSAKILAILREYYKANKPKIYLFEGQLGGMYNESSLESVLKQALQKAKITKPVSLHWLRHSYATHLLENGTDLRYIQEILGHSSSKTTEIYTHVSTKNIQQIKSPFDDL